MKNVKEKIAQEIGIFFRHIKNHSIRYRMLASMLIVVLLVGQTEILNGLFIKIDTETVVAADTESIAVSAFSELPGEVKEQTVAIGTGMEELMLPDTLEAVCVVAISDEDADAEVLPSKETQEAGEDGMEVPTLEESAGDVEEESANAGDTELEEEAANAGDAALEDESANAGDTTLEEESANAEEDEEDAMTQVETFSVTMPEYQAGNVMEIETLVPAEDRTAIENEEAIENVETQRYLPVTIHNVTWQSEPEFDGDTEGEYLFTAVLPDRYILETDVSLPEIKVTVVEKEQVLAPMMGGWYFGEEDVYPQGNLFCDAGSYSLVLAGGSSETQIPFADIVTFLPAAVTVEVVNRAGTEGAEAEAVEDARTEVLPITGWNCPEYVQDAEGNLPCRGGFYFTALFNENDAYEMAEDMTQPGVWVIFDEPMLLSTAVPGVISSDQEWDAQTLTAGTYTIKSGVTVTITGCLTIDGTVTIEGGGKIVRGSSSAYFSVGSAGNLTLRNIEVDGQSVSSSYSLINVSSGSVTLDDGCWIHDCTKNTTKGSALYIEGGTGVFNDVVIENCSASGNGGAIYLYSGSQVTIHGGTYRNNSVRNSTVYGGGFAYNNMGHLYIYGGSFLNNISAGKAGCIYTSSNDDTETWLYGGYFEGNKCTYTGYEGSGALYYSAMYNNDTILQLSGNVHLVGDGTGSGVDGLYLDISSSSSTSKKARISSQLRYPLSIYLKASEGYVIAEGVENYILQESDMKKISFYDIGNSGVTWYAVLDKSSNQIYLSATDPGYGLYITYNGNGASGAVTDDEAYYSGETVTLKSESGFSSAGGTFVEWNTKADGTGTSYQPGEQIVITDDLYLYAQWSFGVTYNYAANGGSSSDLGSANVRSGRAVDLTPQAAKDGWEFVGWNTSQSAQTGLTSLTMGNAPVTLYAIYKKTLTAGFYSGSNNNRQMQSVTIYNNSTSGTVTAPALSSWSGWTASGWSTNADAFTGSILANASVSLTENTDYYGIYQKEITVSYDANGGTGTPQTQSKYRYANVHAATTYQDPSFTLAAAITRTGYIFDGWHMDSASGTVYEAGSAVTLTADTTFYAGWTTNACTVTFDYQGATGRNDRKTITVTYDAPYGELPTPTREGYQFKGWFTAASGGSEIKSDTVVSTMQDHTLYAQWIANTYAITYEKDGGTIVNESSYITYTYGRGLILPTPTKEGYTFAGWYTDAAFSGAAVTTITATETGNKTFYAKWTKNDTGDSTGGNTGGNTGGSTGGNNGGSTGGNTGGSSSGSGSSGTGSSSGSTSGSGSSGTGSGSGSTGGTQSGSENGTSGNTQSGTQSGTGAQGGNGGQSGTNRTDTDTAASDNANSSGSTGTGSRGSSGSTGSAGGRGSSGSTGGAGGIGDTGNADQTDKDSDAVQSGTIENTGDDASEASLGNGQNAGQSAVSGADTVTSVEGDRRTVQAELENGDIVISGGVSGVNGTVTGSSAQDGSGAGTGGLAADGDSMGAGAAGEGTSGAESSGERTASTAIATGTIASAETATTVFVVGSGSVSVTVVSDAWQYAIGIADTVAVTNAVLTTEQKQLVYGGETIEIRIDVQGISEEDPTQDKDIIENGLIAEQSAGQDSAELTLGTYIDISIYVKIGDSDWDAITQSDRPIEVVIGVPEELQSEGRIFYIARAHEGEYALLADLDDVPDTITIQTELFSTYAIVYRQSAGRSGNFVVDLFTAHSWMPAILWSVGILLLIGVMFIIILGKRRKKEEE